MPPKRPAEVWGMARLLSRLLPALLLCLPLTAADAPRVLIVATNTQTLPNGKTSGSFLMEIALPFALFREAGFEVDVVTPKGGPTALYKASRPMPKVDEAAARTDFVARTNASLRPDEVNPDRYAAVFYPGGHGQYFDVASSAELHRLAVQIHARGGLLATAGHGAAMIVRLRTADGRPFAAGKRLTCFPTWGELKYMDLSDFGKLLPFDMEKELREQGALLHVPGETDSRDSAVVVDEPNRLYTGAWATNAEAVARLVIAALKK